MSSLDYDVWTILTALIFSEESLIVNLSISEICEYLKKSKRSWSTKISDSVERIIKTIYTIRAGDSNLETPVLTINRKKYSKGKRFFYEIKNPEKIPFVYNKKEDVTNYHFFLLQDFLYYKNGLPRRFFELYDSRKNLDYVLNNGKKITDKEKKLFSKIPIGGNIYDAIKTYSNSFKHLIESGFMECVEREYTARYSEKAYKKIYPKIKKPTPPSTPKKFWQESDCPSPDGTQSYQQTHYPRLKEPKQEVSSTEEAFSKAISQEKDIPCGVDELFSMCRVQNNAVMNRLEKNIHKGFMYCKENVEYANEKCKNESSYSSYLGSALDNDWVKEEREGKKNETDRAERKKKEKSKTDGIRKQLLSKKIPSGMVDKMYNLVANGRITELTEIAKNLVNGKFSIDEVRDFVEKGHIVKVLEKC